MVRGRPGRPSYGAKSKGKRTLGMCSGCGKLRWLAIVKDEARYAQAGAPAD